MFGLGFAGFWKLVDRVTFRSQDNVNRIEAQLQSIMVKNPKKARPTCTKAFKRQLKTTEDAGLEAAADAPAPGEGAQDDAADKEPAEPRQAEQLAEQLDGVELEVWEISDGEEDSLPALQDGAGAVVFKLVAFKVACMEVWLDQLRPLCQED